MRNSFLTVVGVLSSIVLAFWISDRRAQTSAAYFEPGKPPGLNLPAGTSVRIRLTESVSDESKAGDVLHGLVADGVVINSEVLIPANARALVRVTGIHNHPHGEFADVTLELKELSSTDAHLPMRTAPVKTTLKRMSDMDVLARGIAGMVGGALGAADSASLGQNPGVGAAMGADGLTSEAETPQPGQNIVLFKTTEPIDLTGITW